MKALVGNVAVVVGALIVALGSVEIGLRLFGPEVLAIGNQYVFFRFDPVLGWGNLPGMSGRFVTIEFAHRVDINSDGMRDAEAEPKRDGEFRVAVLGDSFTWGFGVAYGERFTEVIEAETPGTNALNFGVPSYGTVHYLLQFDRVLAMQPDFVVVALCLGNDLNDSIAASSSGYFKPYARLVGDGGAVEVAGYPLPEKPLAGPAPVGVGSSLRIYGLARLALIGLRTRNIRDRGTLDTDLLYAGPETRTPHEADAVARAHRINELLLEQIRDRVQAVIGPGRLAVALVPTKFEYGLRRRLPPGFDAGAVAGEVLRSLNRLGVPAIDGRRAIAPEDFWRVDGHWRASGHLKFGRLLAGFIEDARRRLIGGPGTPAAAPDPA